MNISDVKHAVRGHKKRRRVGRGSGSGWGHTAARGHKGQKARSGYSKRWAFEGGQMPLFRRLPKRGFNNKLFTKTWAVVNTRQLNVFDDGTAVTPELLLERGLIKDVEFGVKVLAAGDLDRKLTVHAHAFSKSATEKIKNAGGEVHPLVAPEEKEKEKEAKPVKKKS